MRPTAPLLRAAPTTYNCCVDSGGRLVVASSTINLAAVDHDAGAVGNVSDMAAKVIYLLNYLWGHAA